MIDLNMTNIKIKYTVDYVFKRERVIELITSWIRPWIILSLCLTSSACDSSVDHSAMTSSQAEGYPLSDDAGISDDHGSGGAQIRDGIGFIQESGEGQSTPQNVAQWVEWIGEEYPSTEEREEVQIPTQERWARTTVSEQNLRLLIQSYDRGEVSSDQLRAIITEFRLSDQEHSDMLSDLSSERGHSRVILLDTHHSPYMISKSWNVDVQGVLLIAPEVSINLAPEAEIQIEGRLFTLGTQEHPIRFTGQGAQEGQRYKQITLSPPSSSESTWLTSNPSSSNDSLLDHLSFRGLSSTWSSVIHTHFINGDLLLSIERASEHPILIERARFDQWTDKAIAFESSDHLKISECEFGLQSEGFEGLGESIRGFRSTVLITRSVFGQMRGYRDAVDLEECHEPHTPIVSHNRFLGGQDDAIDLDGCTAYIVNNHISHFRPPSDRPPSGGVNGGGITGDRQAAPLIMGNFIDDCLHAVGFKDGAHPVLVNNTITRSTIGFTLYKSRSDREAPAGVILNMLFAHNEEDIRLDGSWWPAYDPSPLAHEVLKISFSRLDQTSEEGWTLSSLAGENWGLNPELLWYEGLPIPSSPQLRGQGLEVSGESRSEQEPPEQEQQQEIHTQLIDLTPLFTYKNMLGFKLWERDLFHRLRTIESTQDEQLSDDPNDVPNDVPKRGADLGAFDTSFIQELIIR